MIAMSSAFLSMRFLLVSLIACTHSVPRAPSSSTVSVRVVSWPEGTHAPAGTECWVSWPGDVPDILIPPGEEPPNVFGHAPAWRRELENVVAYLRERVAWERAVYQCLEKMGVETGP